MLLNSLSEVTYTKSRNLTKFSSNMSLMVKLALFMFYKCKESMKDPSELVNIYSNTDKLCHIGNSIPTHNTLTISDSCLKSNKVRDNHKQGQWVLKVVKSKRSLIKKNNTVAIISLLSLFMLAKKINNSCSFIFKLNMSWKRKQYFLRFIGNPEINARESINRLHSLCDQYKYNELHGITLYKEIKDVLYADSMLENPTNLYNFGANGKVDVFNMLENIPLQLHELSNLGIKNSKIDSILIDRIRDLKRQYKLDKITKIQFYEKLLSLIIHDYNLVRPNHLNNYNKFETHFITSEVEKLPLELEQLERLGVKKERFDEIVIEKLRNLNS